MFLTGLFVAYSLHNVTASRDESLREKFRFPDYVTMAQDGGKVVSLTERLLLLSGNTPGTHFC